MPEVRCTCGYKGNVAGKAEAREVPCPLCGRALKVPASGGSGDSAGPGVGSGEPTWGSSPKSGTSPGTSAGASKAPRTGAGVGSSEPTGFDPFKELQPMPQAYGAVSDGRASKQMHATLMFAGIAAIAVIGLGGLIWGVTAVVSYSSSSGSGSSGGSTPGGGAVKSAPPPPEGSIGLAGGEGESGTSKSGRGRGGSDRGHGTGGGDKGKLTGSGGGTTVTENQDKQAGTDAGASSDKAMADKNNVTETVVVDDQKLAALRKNESKGESGNMGASLPEDGLNVPSLAPDLSSILKRKGSGGFGARGVAGRAQRLQNGATVDVERAIEMGVRWLATTQGPDGRWDPKAYGGEADRDLGVTGLALLVFLGEGHHPSSKTAHSALVDRGVNFVLSRQNSLNGGMNASTFYEQGISLMVLSETYALTKDEKYKEPAQKLLDFIVSQSSPNGGYGYTGPGGDTSVTGFQIMGIKSAMMAGLKVPEDAVLRVHTYLRVCTLDDGQAGYNERGDPRISMTSVAMCCRLFLGYGLEDGMVVKAGDLIAKHGPTPEDEYYTYYATYCMFQVGGPKWREWNRLYRPAVLALQDLKTKGLAGSFNPGKSPGASNAGRVYTTAMYLLTLQVYARFLPMYR